MPEDLVAEKAVGKSSGKPRDVSGIKSRRKNGQTGGGGHSDPERGNHLSPGQPAREARCRGGRVKVSADHAPSPWPPCWGDRRRALSGISWRPSTSFQNRELKAGPAPLMASNFPTPNCFEASPKYYTVSPITLLVRMRTLK